MAVKPASRDSRPGRGQGVERGRWRRNWYRLVVPFTVLAVLIGVTLAARAIEDPDLDDPTTLAPAGTGPDGGSELAGLLADNGVTVEPLATLDAAAGALAGGRAVVFIPVAGVGGALLARQAVDAGHRVVLVAPDAYQLMVTGLPVAAGPQRWAALATEPGSRCRLPEALAAGTATALRERYLVEQPADRCYRGGLVRVRMGAGEAYVIGATDPFRNRRIHEHGNAELAVALLARHDRVVWAGQLSVDLLPALPQLRRPPLDRSGGNPLAMLVDGYPPGVLAGLVLAGLLAVLVALARGRRFGPPVIEPLPVLVPAAEVVAGRGRLYQRTRGRAGVLAVLREAALPRLLRALELPDSPPPAPEAVVRAAAARTGQPAEAVRHTLYGPEPGSDEQLAAAVAALDTLVAAIAGDQPLGRKVSP